jgi:hypothetical protein
MAQKDDNEIRFAVGSPNSPLSLVWRLWSLNDNIYIGAKNGDEVFKISLNEEKAWRIAYVKALNQNDSGDDTVMHTWDKPTSTSPEFIHCVSIVVPFINSGITTPRNKAEDARIIWIKESQVEKSIIFKVILSWPRMKRLELGGIMKEGDVLIGNIKKQNGEKVWLLSNEVILSQDQSKAIMESQIEEQHSQSSKILVITDKIISIDNQPTIFDIAMND